MAQTTDLLSTPLLSSHLPPKALLESLTTPVLLDGVDEIFTGRDGENIPESPSPCARKARRVKKNGRRPTTPNNHIIQEMVRKNKSPKFAALFQNLAGSSLDGGSEQGHGNSEHPEDPDNQQEGEQFLPSTELPNLDDASEDSNEEESTPLPTFIPQRHTIRELFHDMKDIMTRTYKDTQGRAYILFDRLNQSPFFKIGQSNNPRHRKEKHERKCQLKGWASRERPAISIRMPMRLERLAQAELQNIKCDPRCSCGVEHVEYFWGPMDIGLEVLDFWCEWLQSREPYGWDGQLKGFWVDRLEQFQTHLHDYFSCGSLQCAEQDEEAPACQACLRAGWKKWVEPTPEDELDYACRANIPSKWVRLRVLSLSTFSVIDNFYLIAFVNLVGQILSMCRWISDPNVFLCVIPLRLLGFWVEPRIRLTGPALGFLLLVVDTTLFVVCVYTRFQHGRGEIEDARTRPRRTRRTKTVSIGEIVQEIDEAVEVSPPPGSNTDTRSASETKSAQGRRKTT
ncbi:hypothetical protein BDW59DRAFT_152169 [Aspergillus cavernicola]|uniref:Bacteriophage T5 Orf172 DNA-binding domain-containing protein n=1 Tax=Aspergillus cavernicola TaxID=176166 RepID=A0ABR4HRU9_9EURO